ncbi:sensor domain-containing diguanylate cyclase [Xanthobacter oligotrophicus]|uniref:sensor domain-containing diguanylate cyclase n=1 Tax=Xanthobacter oligotrophicus TaxID=2607286 RepID=UPI0011F1CA28|nr:GGDEF domain-containing protein [Xanthobacter oligotrophicus]MCG5235996.1 GGDEF domain-containing protein [Xanthobacter oligotrophicus]
MNDILEHLRQLEQSTPVLVALFDASDRLRYANAAFRAAMFIAEGEEISWEEMVRRNYHAGRGTIINTSDIDEWIIVHRSRRGKERHKVFEVDFHDGRWLLVTQVVSADGWMLAHAVDVTAFRPDERAMRLDRDRALYASYTDDLTGVANRRFVAARVADMLAPDGPGGAFCLIDLDQFKAINDRFGHQAGDLILRDFAARMAREVRRADCFGRVGGEEFVLVLPATSAGAARGIVEQALDMVRLARPLTHQPDFSYSFSAGIAQSRLGDTFADLYNRADRALYAAKMAGRSRIHVEQDRPPSAVASAG